MLTLMWKLSGVYCEDLGENWPCYNSTALYDSAIEKLMASWVMYLYYPAIHFCAAYA